MAKPDFVRGGNASAEQHFYPISQDDPSDAPADRDCQLCFEKLGQDRRPAALGCGHATYCKPCLEAYFATCAARGMQELASAADAAENGGESDEADPLIVNWQLAVADRPRRNVRYRCPVGCDLGYNRNILELFL